MATQISNSLTMLYDEKYMRRALQLAQSSPFDTHPNPMVGAVIVCDDKIIGFEYQLTDSR